MGGDWNAVDLAMLLMLGASLVVGGVRGLLYEVLSLAGWLVAYVAARWLGPSMAPLLPVGAPGSSVNLGAAMVTSFIGTLLIWALVTWFLQKLVQASPLKPVDRALGAVFGLTRGNGHWIGDGLAGGHDAPGEGCLVAGCSKRSPARAGRGGDQALRCRTGVLRNIAIQPLTLERIGIGESSCAASSG